LSNVTIKAASVLFSGIVTALPQATLALSEGRNVIYADVSGIHVTQSDVVRSRTQLPLWDLTVVGGTVLGAADLRSFGGVGSLNLKPATPGTPAISSHSISLAAEGLASAVATVTFTLSGVTLDDTIQGIEVTWALAGSNLWQPPVTASWSPLSASVTAYIHGLAGGQNYDVAVNVRGRNGALLNVSPLLIGTSPSITGAAISAVLPPGSVTWNAVKGDTSGDTTTPIADGANKRWLYPSTPTPIQGAINSSGQGLLNAFPGSTLNGDGSLSNVSGSSAQSYLLASGIPFTVSGDVMFSPNTDSLQLVVGNTTNGYYLFYYNAGAGLHYINVRKFVAGVDFSIGGFYLVSSTYDSNYHSFRLTVTPGSPNTLEASVDGAHQPPFTDSSLTLTSGSWPITVGNLSAASAIRNFTTSNAAPHYIVLPAPVQAVVAPVADGQGSFLGHGQVFAPHLVTGIGGNKIALGTIPDDATFVKLLGSHASGNVAYNYKGVWSSGTAYVIGDEVVYGPSYWIAVAGSTNSAPATGNANWQVVGTYSGFQGAWNSGTAYIAGAEVTYSNNYWVCLVANTNSAPTTVNTNWQVAGPTNLDAIADGATYQRMPTANMDANRRGLMDFTQTGHIGKLAANVPYASGASIESLKPAAVGADVTANNTSYDTSRVNAVAAASISPIATLMPAQAGADVTGSNTALDTSNVSGTAAATVKGGAVRANAAIDSGNVVVAAGLDFTRGYTNKGALATKNAADLSTGDVINKFAQYVTYTGGATVDSLKPAAVGADVTANNTSYDTARVNAVAAASISPIATLMPAEAGANVTATWANQSTAVSTALNSSGKLLASEFAGGTQNGDGTFSNVDIASSATKYSTTVGSTVLLDARIARGSTGSDCYLGLGTGGSNIYLCYWNSAGALFVYKYAAGVGYSLGAIGGGSITADTADHHYVLQVTFGASANTIEAYIDGNYFPLYIDAANLPTFASTVSASIGTGGNTGKLRQYNGTTAQTTIGALPQVIQNRNGIILGQRGAPPYVDNSNVLQFPSLVKIIRAGGTVSNIPSGTTLSLVSSLSAGVFAQFVSAGSISSIVSISNLTGGGVGTGYSATLASPLWELVGITSNFTSPYTLTLIGGNAQVGAAAFDVLGFDPVALAGNFHAGKARSGTNLPYGNHSSVITGAIDSGGVATAAAVDFTRAYTGKNQDNVGDGGTYARVLLTELASNKVKQLNDGTNTRTAANVAAVVNASGSSPATTPFNSVIPSQIAYGTDFTLSGVVANVSPYYMKYFIYGLGSNGTGGSGTSVTFWLPDGSSVTAASRGTSGAPISTGIATLSGDVVYFLVWYVNDTNGYDSIWTSTGGGGIADTEVVGNRVANSTGWRVNACNGAPFGPAQRLNAYKDGGLIASLTDVTSSSITSSPGGSPTRISGCPEVDQFIERKTLRGSEFVKARELRKGDRLRDPLGRGWNRILNEVTTGPALIYDVTIGGETVAVDASHTFQDANDKWINVRDLRLGHKMHRFDRRQGRAVGTAKVTGLRERGRGEMVHIQCERQVYVLGRTVSHNIKIQLSS
jgi:hypothetical protein